MTFGYSVRFRRTGRGEPAALRACAVLYPIQASSANQLTDIVGTYAGKSLITGLQSLMNPWHRPI